MKISRTTDYEIIAELNKPVHYLHAGLYPKVFKKYNFEAIKDYFKTIIDNDKFIFLLVEDSEKAVGYAWIEIKEYPENAFKKGYTSIYVHQISIQETERKNGYGSGIMEEIYTLARNEGIGIVELDYWIDNSVAKDFYKKHDFQKSREFVYKTINEDY